MKFSRILIVLIFIFLGSNLFAQAVCVDTDGDGWGWDGSGSCLVEPQDSDVVSTPEVISDRPCVDTDGDGWGWNGVASCLPAVEVTEPEDVIEEVPESEEVVEEASESNPIPEVTSDLICIDTDGDGWGWSDEGSCLVVGEPTPIVNVEGDVICEDLDGDGYGWNGVMSCDPNYIDPLTEVEETESDDEVVVIPEVDDTDPISTCSVLTSENRTSLVTDVILTAGQSNATGFNTDYDPETYDEDKVSPRLIVWTEINGWQVADPQTQLWDAENYVPNVAGSSTAYNHPAFQIGKSILSNDPCRVVAIITTAAPGKRISHWLNNVNNHFDVVNNKVEAALLELPNKSQIDMMWWMQGESDNDLSETDYTFSLNTLLGEFRDLSWFGSDKYFLANETRRAIYTNVSIRALRGNGDINTDYSVGEDECNLCTLFPHIIYPDNPSDIVHFNEIAFRKIGKAVASKYLSDYVNR